MKLAINTCVGKFDLSAEADKLLHSLSGARYHWELRRDDPNLLTVVETLGKKANGRGASIKIVEIPDDVQWELHDYMGQEHVAEICRIWR
jgi:hypothetical protein